MDFPKGKPPVASLRGETTAASFPSAAYGTPGEGEAERGGQGPGGEAEKDKRKRADLPAIPLESMLPCTRASPGLLHPGYWKGGPRYCEVCEKHRRGFKNATRPHNPPGALLRGP